MIDNETSMLIRRICTHRRFFCNTFSQNFFSLQEQFARRAASDGVRRAAAQTRRNTPATRAARGASEERDRRAVAEYAREAAAAPRGAASRAHESACSAAHQRDDRRATDASTRRVAALGARAPIMRRQIALARRRRGWMGSSPYHAFSPENAGISRVRRQLSEDAAQVRSRARTSRSRDSRQRGKRMLRSTRYRSSPTASSDSIGKIVERDARVVLREADRASSSTQSTTVSTGASYARSFPTSATIATVGSGADAVERGPNIAL